MPYPLDDNGNIRVDFVWGNFPLQPDEQRTGLQQDWVNESNQPEDKGWTARSYGAISDTLPLTATQNLTLGDQNQDDSWQEPDTRSVTVPTIHDIATTGYNNYPSFIPNYAGDGDAGLETTVPDLSQVARLDMQAVLADASLGFVQEDQYAGSTLVNDGKFKAQSPQAGVSANADSNVIVYFYQAPNVPNVVDFDSVSAAESYLGDFGLVLGTVTTSTVGATAENNNWVKSQSPAAGTKVAAGTAVNLVEYDYVVTSTTGPISGMNRTNPAGSGWNLNGDDAVMYVVGRTVKPAIGTTITVAGSSSTKWNQNWTVVDVINDDTYNTGGTAVKVTALDDATFATPDTSSTGGTWTVVTP